jgi:hypothetical protein
MFVQYVNRCDILTDRSRFSLQGVLYDDAPDQQCFVRSCEKLGIVNPVILFRDRESLFHLVDGLKRVQYAGHKQLKTLAAVVLPEYTPATEIVTLILLNRKSVIEASIINRIRFIRFALLSGAPESWVVDTVCPSFGLKPHSSFLKECGQIESLPAELQHFSHEKRFSLKQLLNLACYPPEVLQQLVQWNADLHLTASVMDEIASGLKDYLAFQNLRLEEFLADPEVDSLLCSSLSPRSKTEKLRQLLYEKRFPVLSQANAKIRECIENLKLPGNMTIDWDRTLENRRIGITLQLNDGKQWPEILKRLGKDDLTHTFGKILNEL